MATITLYDLDIDPNDITFDGKNEKLTLAQSLLEDLTSVEIELLLETISFSTERELDITDVVDAYEELSGNNKDIFKRETELDNANNEIENSASIVMSEIHNLLFSAHGSIMIADIIDALDKVRTKVWAWGSRNVNAT